MYASLYMDMYYLLQDYVVLVGWHSDDVVCIHDHLHDLDTHDNVRYEEPVIDPEVCVCVCLYMCVYI
jgi:hypothetical protein